MASEYKIDPKKVKKFLKKNPDLYNLVTTALHAWMGEANSFCLEAKLPGDIIGYTPTTQTLNFLKENELLVEKTS